MREHSDARVALAQLLDIVCGEFFMHLAATLPSDDAHTGQSCDVLRQVLVGNEYDFRHAKALHHFLRVGRSTADIALRLHIRAGINDDRLLFRDAASENIAAEIRCRRAFRLQHVI